MFETIRAQIEAQIRAFLQQAEIPFVTLKWSPLPFEGAWGLSTSFFQTAAAEARTGKKVNVPQRAQEIAAMVSENLHDLPGVARVEAVRGYLNLYFNTGEIARRVVDAVLSQGVDYGRGPARTERVMVEYAQPNTHHSFHIGHYRNAVLGESLARLMDFAGYETIRAAYPGDIGLGVITVLWIYDKFYKGQEPQGVHERGQWLLKLYVEASQMLTPRENETPTERAQREAWDAERREMYRRWDAGDPYVRQLWETTRAWSLEELRAILDMLDIKIDVWFYESQVDEPAKAIVAELIERGIARDERPEGPVIVKIDEQLGLKKDKYRTAVILRSDGTTLYLTKDLALAKLKFEEYGVDRSIYVVDNRQSLHFQQVFKILELWGFEQARQCYHLAYGFVSLPEGAMSSRAGRLVLFKDVADEAIARVRAASQRKNPGLPEDVRDEAARMVGLGAMAYAMLFVDNNRDIVFEMDRALSFEGRTGPYIQNAHVRAGSILRKAGGLPSEADFAYPLGEHELTLVDMLARFPDAVQQAAEEYRPMVMAAYAYELATAFHAFYHAAPVLQMDAPEVRAARLRLVAAARQTLANALYLLGMHAPEVM